MCYCILEKHFIDDENGLEVVFALEEHFAGAFFYSKTVKMLHSAATACLSHLGTPLCEKRNG